MSARELVVLGTASQVPTRHRNHNGYFVRWDQHGFMFDPGEGTQRQMIHYGVTATSITKIMISHFHGDHCLGFASLVQRISLDNVPHTIDAFYPGSGQKFYDRLRKASIFYDVADVRPCPIDADGASAPFDDLTVTWRALSHNVDCYGFRIAEADKFRFDKDKLASAGIKGAVVGELARGKTVEIEGKTIRREDYGELRRGNAMAFVMDTRKCDAAVELARDVDLLVIESTYLHEAAADADKNGHLTAREAAEIARKAGARKVVLTHFSQRYPDTRPFLAEANEVHPDVVLASDGLVVGIPRPQGLA
ncbi:MAG: ribonuclease Z [Myxococcota bacterium]